MEHANSTTSLRQHLQQQQQQHQHHQLQQHTQLQNDNQQQFCLRWHNHQTSLLSTLPILLDQSHLTDVTLSAEGRTLRAHRVVLSACSTFFLELFRALETATHPVIIIPGASFSAIVALLTFMYSGEVNVYEAQIPTLLSLAETLGIKGLADVQNNLHKNNKRHSDFSDQQQQPPQQPQPHKFEVETPPTPLSPPDFTAQHGASLLPPPTPLTGLPSAAAGAKLPTPLENLFLKSLQFYPNLLPQPLNFSQSALNKTSELLAKYQQHCNLYQSAFSGCISPLSQQLDEASNEPSSSKRLCTIERRQQQQQQHQQQKDIKRIDKIVESLRCSNKTPVSDGYMTAVQHQQAQQQQQQQQQQPLPTQQHLPPLTIKAAIASFGPTLSSHIITKPPPFTTATYQQHQKQQQQPNQPSTHRGYISLEEPTKLQQQLEHFAATPEAACMPEKLPTPTPVGPQPKAPSNSKLYATCFICHKQLSNQYNLRVHLETHQNVRYACNVCSHVSRSKDALRKHVSYRHPGAPSPCESEARRKRCKTLNMAAAAATSTVISTTTPSPSSAPTTPISMGGNSCSSGEASAVTATTTAANTPSTPTSAPLSAAYMFLPNQFHLAAAAAAASGQQTIGNSNNACSIISSNAINTTTTSSILNTTKTTVTAGASAATCNLTATTSASTATRTSPSASTQQSADINSNSSTYTTTAAGGTVVGPRLPTP